MCIMTSGVRKAIKQIFGTNVHFVIDERASKWPRNGQETDRKRPQCAPESTSK